MDLSLNKLCIRGDGWSCLCNHSLLRGSNGTIVGGVDLSLYQVVVDLSGIVWWWKAGKVDVDETICVINSDEVWNPDILQIEC